MAGLPLEGLTIGITADRRAEEQAQLFVQRGAKVVHGPTIRTAAIDDQEPARCATLDLIARPPDVVVANTAVGIRTWLALADAWGLTDALLASFGGAYVVARGPKAAGALLAVGVDIQWRPSSAVLADVVDHLRTRDVAGLRIALQLDGAVDNSTEAAELRALGGEVIEIRTYQWGLPRDPTPALRLVDAACNARLDALTFTAAPAVRNLFELAEGVGAAGALREALNGPVLAMCVGPVCRQAAIHVGLDGAVEPPTARIGGMVKALSEEFRGRRREFRIGNLETEMQGSLVRAGGVGVSLPSRERAVFEVLARRPGVVVPRRALLSEVWGSADTDPHALEVTVGRLRRRLTPTGVGVEAVLRRGYRLAARP